MKYQIKQRVKVRELGYTGTITEVRRPFWGLGFIVNYEVLLDNRSGSVNKNSRMTYSSGDLEVLAVQEQPAQEYKTKLGQGVRKK